jgi:hypothetical protein
MKLQVLYGALVATALAIGASANSAVAPAAAPALSPEAAKHFHDFDYLVGNWKVAHHELKARLVGSHEWLDFGGTSALKMILDGYGTFDENTIDKPTGSYKGVTVRTFDPKTGIWSVYWLDSRFPGVMDDEPMHGNFDGNVGTFWGTTTFNGKPIKVRYIWKLAPPNGAHWEQAFSPDGGKTWEANWEMELTRVTAVSN